MWLRLCIGCFWQKINPIRGKKRSGVSLPWRSVTLVVSYSYIIFSKLYSSKFTPTVQDLVYLYWCQKNWATSKGSSNLMSCNWNSPMETGAAGNLVCSRTKEGVQSHCLKYHLAPWPHSYCQLQCGERLSNAALLNLLFKGCLRGLSRVCPHVWPQGPIEITSAVTQSLLAGQSLQAAGTHGSVCMVSAGPSGTGLRQGRGGEEGGELCAVMNNNLLLLGDTEKYFKNWAAKSLNWISS